MPFHSTPAVVLNCQDFGELDKKVALFTRDFGRLNGIAKGAKKSKKRFGANLDLFAYVDVVFFEGHSSLARIEESSFIRPFKDLTSDLLKFSHASYLIQLVDEMTGERQKEKSLFEHLVYFLTLLDDGSPKEDLLRIFEIRLLGTLGFKPRLDGCFKCAQFPDGRKHAWFSVARGGMLCARCAKGLEDLLPVSLDTSKVMRFAQNLNLQSLGYLSFSKQVLSEFKQILPAFIHYHLGKRTKSGDFLNKLSHVRV